MEKQKRAEYNKKGFTLVEAIVVGVILVLLLSIGGAGMVKYYHYSMYKKNNEYARSIFAAAQSSLTHYKTSGKLTDLEELMKVDENKVSADIAGEYTDRLYYLDFTKADYQNIMTGGAATEPYAQALYDLVKDYIYEQNIFDAAIRIEMDPSDGMVYSVCYSNRAEAFDESGSDGKDGAVMGVNKANREEERRKEILLGYYDAGTLTEQAPKKKEKSTVQSAELLNGDTLMLRFNMRSKDRYMTYGFQYTVEIYEKTANNSKEKKLMSFVINTLEDNNTLSPYDETKDMTITCDVQTYDTSSGAEKEKIKDVKFPAYVTKDASQRICLILDAADLEASDVLKKSGTDYRDTYSAMRLGLAVDQKIYANVQATNPYYKPSSMRKSNDEVVYMGSVSGNETDRQFSVKNARHLFNLRFTETWADTDSTVKTVKYTQSSNITWGGASGIIAGGNLYEKQKAVGKDTSATTAFPSIAQLGDNSTYTRNNNYAISELLLKAEESIVKEKTYKERLGLFATNKGIIEKLILENVRVEGIVPETGEKINYVGAVCGLNEGTLSEITVQEKRSAGQKAGEACYVKGGNYVGGIAGSDVDFTAATNEVGKMADASGQTYSKMTSEAMVNGGSYVGGIFGYSNGASIRDSANKGRVRGVEKEDGTGANGSENIGGIVGYKENGEIQNCTSTIGEKLGVLTEDEVQTYLVGRNVGGIAGTAQSVNITNCQTGGGTVTGDEYVGGIVGNTVKPGNTIEGNNKTNAADVMANRYAGGIAGANEGIIKNWNNTGVVTAYKAYAGGITGRNSATGEIINSVSNADISRTGKDALLAVYESRAQGDYVGGIVGANDGSITAENVTDLKVSSIAIGGAYVGGIVGCNGETGRIAGAYQLSGGYIMGEVMVGGYAGANLSGSQIENMGSLTIKPNIVCGEYAVGGIFGANIIGLAKDITIENANMDNFLGRISSDINGGENPGAFVGGIFGYNYLYAGGNQNAGIIEAALTGLKDKHSVGEALMAVQALNVPGSARTLTFENASNRMSSIQGGICVGGIVGYNDAKSRLTVSNTNNQTPIIATAVVSTAEQTSLGENISYSYAGGITGLVTDNMILDACQNTDRGMLTTPDTTTYHGSVAEVNNGTIQNCSARTLGHNGMNYIGGIVGRNNKDIIQCSAAGTIVGNKVVGGIAAENYGTIKAQNDEAYYTIHAAIMGNETRIGGVAGYNGTGGTITGANLTGRVSAESAEAVGGIAGYSSGATNRCAVAGSANIRGDEYVGGYVGWLQNSAGLSDLAFAGSVYAVSDYAGGIVGYANRVDIDTTFERCSVSGSVEAASGRAGGILAYMNEEIHVNNCTLSNGAEVRAGNGLAGGIVSYNDGGTIAGCTIGQEGVFGNNISVTGAYQTGGISAVNRGMIQNCRVYAIHLASTTAQKHNAEFASDGYCIGAVTGINRNKEASSAFIQNIQVGEASRPVNIDVPFDKMCGGGIAGINEGKITVFRAKSNMVYANIQTASVNAATSLGGAAGENGEHAYLRNTIFSGNITGQKGGDNGYGGISGVNAGEISGCAASGNILAAGHAASLSYIGGIAGNLKATGVIKDCTIGVTRETFIGTKTDTSYNYVGGIAGNLEGTIDSINMTADQKLPTADDILTDGVVDKTKVPRSTCDVTIQNAHGHVGGIAGFATITGSVSNCQTNSNWTVEAKKTATDNAVGGIIGYSKAENFSRLVNYAAVKKDVPSSNSVGGILGRQENMETNSWTIKDVINAGYIYGKERVSGVIGQWKYKGGTIENAVNYGEIEAVNYLGGVVGYIYAANSGDYLDIVNCINYGKIKGGGSADYIAGIVGGDRFSAPVIRVAGCINIGNITGTSKGAGIYGNSVNASSVVIRNCQNYGNAGERYKDMAGMYSASGGNKKNVTVENSLGVSGITYPVINEDDYANSGAFAENYYFSTDKAALRKEPEKILYRGLSSSDITDNKPAANALDGNDTTRWATDVGSVGNEGYLSVAFENEQKISSFAIDFFSEGRQYKYYLEAQTSAGETKYLHKVGENTYEWQDVKPGDANRIAGTGRADNPSAAELVKIQFPELQDVVTLTLRATANNKFLSVYEIRINDKTFSTKEKEYQAAVTKSKGYDKGGAAALNKITTEDRNIWEADFTGVYEPLIKNIEWTKLTWMKLPTGEQESIADNIITYETLKDSVNEFYRSHFASMEAPSNVQVNDEGDNFKVTWNSSSNAYAYEILVDAYETEEEARAGASHPKAVNDKNIWVRGGTTGLIPLDSSWKYINVFVRAVNLDNEKTSDAAAAGTQAISVKAMLPTPQAHLELEYPVDGKYYKLVLDNLEDYENLGISDTDINILVSGPVNQNVSLRAIKDKTASLMAGGSNSGQILNISAVLPNNASGAAKSKYRNSAANISQLTLPDYDLLAPKDTGDGGNLRGVIAKFYYDDAGKYPYFQGTTLNDFSYVVRLKEGTIKEMYQRSEILAYDAKTGMDVVLSYGDLRVPGTEPGQTVYEYQVALTGVSEEILRQVYEAPDLPNQVILRSYLHNAQGYMAYFGKKEPVAENITADEVKREYTADCYSVHRNSDGTYTVYESRLLAANIDADEKNPYRIQVTEEAIPLPEQLPKPAIAAYGRDADGNYIFQWDKPDDREQGGNYANPQYRVVITGTNAADGQVPILDETITRPDGTGSYQVVLSEAQMAGYKNINVKVTRIGTNYPDKDVTQYMGSDSSVDFKFLLKLDQPTGIRAELTDGDRNNRNYDIIWRTIQNEEQLKDLQAYRVKVTGKDEIGKFVEKVYDVIADSEGKISGSMTINFDDTEYENVDQVQITVTAIADTGRGEEQVYTDSDPSDVYTLDVPKRLPAPDMTSADANWTVGLYRPDGTTLVTPADVWSVSEFTGEGFLFKLNYTGDKKDVSAAYQMTAAIYDDWDAAKNQPAGEPLEIIGSEENPIVMGGNGTMADGSQLFTGLSQDYAGKYLVLQARTTSTQEISSTWSAQTAYQLPKIRLDAPVLNESTENIKVQKTDETDEIPLESEEVTRTNLSWYEDSYADYYRLTFTDLHYEKDTAGNIKSTQIEIHNPTQPGETWRFEVTVPDADGNPQTLPLVMNPEISDDTQAVYEAELDVHGYDTTAINVNGALIPVRFRTIVRAVINLAQPDYPVLYQVLPVNEEGLKETTAEESISLYYTGSITVETMAETAAGTESNYTSSLRSQWINLQQESVYSTLLRILADTDALDVEPITDGNWRVLRRASVESLPWSPDRTITGGNP